MKLSSLLPWRKKPIQKNWVPTDQGLMNTSWDAGWWQQNLQPLSGSGLNEVVEACVSALSQTTAMCPVHHLELKDDGEQERLIGSLPERVLLNPNQYTTRTQFFNTLIRSTYLHGNGYAVATRDGNRAIKELHIVDPRGTHGVIDPESGEVYYWVTPNVGSTNFNAETDTVYLARDVLHIRINVGKEPLKGESPITAAANSIAANGAITGHQKSFFGGMSRPSGILQTDQQLNLEQMKQLRQALEAQSTGPNSGGVPILGNNLKWQAMSLTSQDSQMVEAFGMTIGSISRVFRVPLPLINDMTGATFANSEALMNWFLSSGLGFLLEHIELELGKLFGLPFKQRMNFDTHQLMRSDFKTLYETLTIGVQGGIMSPNEARSRVGYGAVEGGYEPRVQQQVVPLTAWDQEQPEPVVEEEEPEDIEAALMGGVNKGFKYG